MGRSSARHAAGGASGSATRASDTDCTRKPKAEAGSVRSTCSRKRKSPAGVRTACQGQNQVSPSVGANAACGRFPPSASVDELERTRSRLVRHAARPGCWRSAALRRDDRPRPGRRRCPRRARGCGRGPAGSSRPRPHRPSRSSGRRPRPRPAAARRRAGAGGGSRPATRPPAGTAPPHPASGTRSHHPSPLLIVSNLSRLRAPPHPDPLPQVWGEGRPRG